MKARRRTRKASRKRHVFHGFEGYAKRKTHRRRRHSALMGGGAGMKKISGTAVKVLAGVGGAVGAAYIEKFIPMADQRIKTAVPFAGGIALASFAKNPLLQAIGMGMAIVGGAGLVRAFIPALPALGDSQLVMLPDGSVATAGEVAQIGAVTDISGDEFDGDDLDGMDDLDGDDDGISGYITQASM